MSYKTILTSEKNILEFANLFVVQHSKTENQKMITTHVNKLGFVKIETNLN